MINQSISRSKQYRGELSLLTDEKLHNTLLVNMKLAKGLDPITGRSLFTDMVADARAVIRSRQQSA